MSLPILRNLESPFVILSVVLDLAAEKLAAEDQNIRQTQD